MSGQPRGLLSLGPRRSVSHREFHVPRPGSGSSIQRSRDHSGELTTPAEAAARQPNHRPQLFGAALGDGKGTWARSQAPLTEGREHNAPRIGFEEPGGFGITIADANMPLGHAHRSQTA